MGAVNEEVGRVGAVYKELGRVGGVHEEIVWVGGAYEEIGGGNRVGGWRSRVGGFSV